MTLSVTIDLPEPVQQQMEETAQLEQRPVADIIRDLVLQHWPITPKLPDDVEAELAALPNLSDDALWILARSTLSALEQAELAALNQKAKTTNLTVADDKRLSVLLEQYDRTMVRRAEASAILQQRGYDLRDPAVLQIP